MTNNELSRKALAALNRGKKSMRFKELIEAVGAEPRPLFKNLFFLEERGLVQLSTSYPTDAVYPQIHLVRLREEGERLLADAAALDRAFPLSDDLGDKSQDRGQKDSAGDLSYGRALELLALKIKDQLPAGEREAALDKIESLLGLPFINDRVRP